MMRGGDPHRQRRGRGDHASNGTTLTIAGIGTIFFDSNWADITSVTLRSTTVPRVDDFSGFLIFDNVTILTAGDADGDGLADDSDNCVNEPNADQRDVDGDRIGSACDPDLDNNCSVNFADLGLFKAVFFTADENADFDDSGSVNFADLGVVKQYFFQAPGPSGVPNACAP
jgi:hypothetical protein